MKHSILILTMITLSNLGFSQNIKQTKKETDTLSVSKVKEKSNNAYQSFGDSEADAISKMSKEEKDWYISTFVYERGHFFVPDKPISYPFKK